MTSCPSCGALVPEAATRCKDCFADLTATKKKSNTTLVALLGMFALMAIIGAGVLYYGATLPLEERILVDEDTRSIIWTTKYRSGIETKRLSWDQVQRLESGTGSAGGFEVVAIDLSGNRHTVMRGEVPLAGEASSYASLMNKPFTDLDNIENLSPAPSPTPAPTEH